LPTLGRNHLSELLPTVTKMTLMYVLEHDYIPGLERLGQENPKFLAILGYIARHCLKI
jgi:hypothetical protein